MVEAIEKFQKDFVISHETLALVAEIDEFKGKWTALKNLSPDRLQALRRVATIESVGSSTRIEGVKLSDREVENLLSGLQTYSFKSRDEEEVAEYAAAMDLIYDAWREIELTENHVKQIHSVLLKFSGKDTAHRGEYKKFSNNVAAFDADGKEIGVVFETSQPFDVPSEMEMLIRWTQGAAEIEKIHPLLIIAAFVVCLLAIHPFTDGNGRLSRILTTLLLLRSGYEYVPYSSLESVIEDNKESYYKALRRTQTTLKNKKTDWSAWCEFFLKCLKKQKDKLAVKLERENIIARNLRKLSEEIVALLREHGKLGIGEIENLTKANRNTLKVRLRELVNDGLIEQNGQARATFYSLKTQ